MQQQRLSDLKKTLQRELVRTHKHIKKWATQFKIHKLPVEGWEKCTTEGVWIFKCIHLLCGF